MIMMLIMMVARLMAYAMKLAVIGLVVGGLLYQVQQHQCNNPQPANASELLLGTYSTVRSTV
jgi:hypothetical protein